MRNATTAAGKFNALTKADRLIPYLLRTCTLNLIAQIALGTPMAAQTQAKFYSSIAKHNPSIVFGLTRVDDHKR